MSKKILVTGGAGYIGSHNVKELQRSGYDVVVIDNLSTGFKQAVLGVRLIEMDLANVDELNRIMSDEQFDAVMHFAGSIIVPESTENPTKYYKNNTANTLSLIECCIKHKVNNFIFSSTAAVYGELKLGVADEETPKEPINPYGMSKLMSEFMLRDTSIAHKDFNFVALRYFNVSGADLDGEIGQAFEGATHLIKVNCEAAAGKRDKTYIFGTNFDTEDGTGIRDYIHVVDLAKAHLKALEYLIDGGDSNVFNCGYGHGYSVKEVVSAVKKVTEKNYDVIETSRRAGDPALLVSKVEKIKKVLGWKPEYDDLDLIIKTAYDWEKSDVLKQWRSQR